VIGIALLQAFLDGGGSLVVGVPAACVLAFIALLLGILQIGPSFLFVPVVIWSWTAMEPMHALLFTAYMVPVSLIGNVLRPFLMARGLTTPMPVILLGVSGGISVEASAQCRQRLSLGPTGIFRLTIIR